MIRWGGPLRQHLREAVPDSIRLVSTKEIHLRKGTDKEVFFVLKSLVPPESSQDYGNFPVYSFLEANFPQRKPALRL